MKKIILAVLLLLTLSPFARAAEVYTTAGDLWQAWAAKQPDWRISPYPDYVCGMWSTDGGLTNMTIAVTDDDAGEAGRQALYDLIENDATLTVVTARYSYAELMEVRLKLEEQLGQYGTNFIGIYEMDNCIHIGIDTSHPDAQAFMDEVLQKHGDMVMFEQSDGPILTYDTLATEEKVSSNPLGLWALFLLLATGAGAGLIFLHRQRSAAVQTNTGIVVGTTVFTRAGTEQLVKNSTETPPLQLLSQIKKKLP